MRWKDSFMTNLCSTILRDDRPFEFQQPFLRLQALSAAIAVELAIPADHAMTGDDQRHGVGGIGAPDGTRGKGSADLEGNIVICARLAVGNSEDRLECLALKRAEERPVNGDGKCIPFAIQIFPQFSGVRCELLRVRLQRPVETLYVIIKTDLRGCPFHGDQTEV